MKWISVKEKCPKVDEPVLVVAVGSCEYGDEEHIFIAEYDKNQEWSQADSSGYSFGSADVTHWMPLPPKPKDDK